MKTFEKFINTLTGVEYWVTVPLFLLMLLMMFVQVVCRYFLKIPLSFSEELCRFLFVACTFMGAAIATAERGHIEINFVELSITSLTKKKEKQIKAGVAMNVVRDLGAIVCLSYVTYQTFSLVMDQYSAGSTSTAMAMPFWFVTSFMLVGLALCIVHSIGLIILNLNGRGPMGYEFMEGEDTSCSL